jgi:glycosyltransferase involved in cell wall biosynthesis
MIVGTRGVPAKHGGFETFAEDLSLFLASRGHHVTVYCQTSRAAVRAEDTWNQVHRVVIPSGSHALGTIYYDWITTKNCSQRKGVVLTLGYNTAVFSLMYRVRRLPNVMNMDGIEWKRAKWSVPQRAWLWFNEWAGARFANHLVADHPEIAQHLRRHTSAGKITVIPYGADAVTAAPTEFLAGYGLKSKRYYLLIARPEPENSILEIVRAFSTDPQGDPLIVLGNYSGKGNGYRQQVLDSAGPRVHFVGAIYDREVVRALRFHAKAYIHGHRVGGTNPSLVESLAAGNAIIAHDNRFTRWVAGERARFFKDTQDLKEILRLLERNPSELSRMEEASRQRHRDEFEREKVLLAYEELLLRAEQSYKQKKLSGRV